MMVNGEANTVGGEGRWERRYDRLKPACFLYAAVAKTIHSPLSKCSTQYARGKVLALRIWAESIAVMPGFAAILRVCRYGRHIRSQRSGILEE